MILAGFRVAAEEVPTSKDLLDNHHDFIVWIGMEKLVEERRPVRILTAMPADTNPDGDIFGGWLMSAMDLAGGAICKRHAGGRVVTVAVEGFKFLSPVKVGDEVIIYADIVKTGRTSMSVKVCTYARGGCTGQETKVCEAIYVFVHVGDDGRPKSIPWL